jgi:hypothetical protein
MRRKHTLAIIVVLFLFFLTLLIWADDSQVGREVAIPHHLQDGDEFKTSLKDLLRYGEKLFTANFTIQEGAGRPLSKGTGAPLSDRSAPLMFPRNFNRISGPDANSCAGCHNEPYTGGGGDRVTEVFVTAQRFDFATFNHTDAMPTKGAVDERGLFVTQGEDSGSMSIGNERKTIGMFGSGFLEMIARQVTADLQKIRDATPPGHSSFLMSKGIAFGPITHNPDGTWETSQVSGLPPSSLASSDPKSPPSLLICLFHQAGVVVSLREFTNNSFNQHHGMQAEERVGVGIDADGDGVVNELTTADITAVTLYQATLPVPGRVHSSDPKIREAENKGERLFREIACATCHIPALPLDEQGWIYSEPNPYNPPQNLRPGAPGYPLKVDLTSDELPEPRLYPVDGTVLVPAYTDLKLHDITTGANDPNAEPLDQNHPLGSPGFFAGNTKFLTKKLWGFANSGPFMHHGKFTTIREAVLAHAGEALFSRMEFQALSPYEQGCVIEFLKSLQVLPQGTKDLEITSTAREEH